MATKVQVIDLVFLQRTLTFHLAKDKLIVRARSTDVVQHFGNNADDGAAHRWRCCTEPATLPQVSDGQYY